MLGKSPIAVFFQWFVVPDIRKVRLAKAAGAEVAVQPKSGTTLRREAHLHVKMYKAPQLRSHFQVSTRHCGAKSICKSKCTKHLSAGAIFEVQISKNGTPLWREAHVQVKFLKD